MTKKSNLQTTISTPKSRLAWFATMMTCTSRALAFQSARDLHVTILGGDFVRDSAIALGRTHAPRQGPLSAVPTRLQYRDGNDDTASSSSPFKWLNTVLPSQRDEEKEQESVDEYLEFLDRRYRRLHTTEKAEPTKPFSALNWLKQGSPSRNDLIASQQQEEDALYVLGVAGLASQKLLHKHHHFEVEEKEVVAAQVARGHNNMHIMDADIVQSGAAALLIRRVLVPLIRVAYVVQRRKDMFVNSQLRRVKKLSSAVFQSVVKAVLFGPAATAKAILEVGGGKKSIALTIATVSTLFFLFRPVIQAAITEATVSP